MSENTEAASGVPSRKTSGCKIAAIVVGVIALLGFVGVMVLVALVGAATKPLVQVTDAHFEAISAGQDQDAFDMTSKVFRENTSFEQFKQFVEERPVLRQIVDIQYSSRKIDTNSGYLSGKVITEGGEEYPVEVKLDKEGGEWKVMGINFPDK